MPLRECARQYRAEWRRLRGHPRTAGLRIEPEARRSQRSIISRSFARISDATSGMRAAISCGMETTPWTSAYSRSPDRTGSPKISEVDNFPLLRANFGCHFGNARGNIVRNGDDSVDIRVQQVSGSNRKPEDLDQDSKIDNVHVCVGNGHSRSEHRELHSAHCGDIAYGAVSDHALALEGLENRRVDLANGRGAAGSCIQILEDGNAGDRQQADGLPPIGAINVGVTRHRRIR